MFNNKSILITGGTGSFGKAFVSHVIKKFKNIKRLVIFSRDELKQYDMRLIYPEKKYPFLRFFIGDIRDKERLKTALNNVDFVIHAAALKQVPAAEYNPIEFIKTNIIGAQNLIEACLEKKINKVIALSTDKAAAPINLYGATKLCSDKLFVAANNIRGESNISFSVVRYGNVMGSRGSVIPYFKSLKKNEKFPITDLSMTRFNITLQESIEFVLKCIKISVGGEIFVPKIPSYKIVDLAKAVDSNAKFKVIGIRPGEKIHEELITESDSYNTLDIGNYYVILPKKDKTFYKKYLKINKTKNENKFSYNSYNNKIYLSLGQLRKLISAI
jgi:UDP-N-acetylglucosamine 4,6-dehydratase (inverting)